MTGGGTGTGVDRATGVGISGQRSRRRGERDTTASYDPNNPWATEEGGPALIEPHAEPARHEPGPGVIGLDR